MNPDVTWGKGHMHIWAMLAFTTMLFRVGMQWHWVQSNDFILDFHRYILHENKLSGNGVIACALRGLTWKTALHNAPKASSCIAAFSDPSGLTSHLCFCLVSWIFPETENTQNIKARNVWDASVSLFFHITNTMRKFLLNSFVAGGHSALWEVVKLSVFHRLTE